MASALALVSSIAFAQTPPAIAQQNPVLALRAGGAIDWDSNVFRLSSSVNPQSQLGTSTKSESVTSAFVGVSVDKRYSLQRYYLDATDTAYRHANFSYLDFDAFEYRGGWDWQVGPRLSGTLSADRSVEPVSRADFRNIAQRNTLTTEHQLASFDGWLSGGWHVLLAGTRDVAKNSVPFLQLGSYRLVGGDVGFKYVTQAGTVLELHRASARAKYLDQPLDPARLIDDGFRRNENYALATLPLSAKSTLRGRAGVVHYNSDNFAQRDFSGAVGALSYGWRPTGKLTLVLSVARDRTPYIDTLSSYVVNDAITFAPTWTLSPKTALGLTLSHTSTDYGGAVVATAEPLRHDRLSSAQIDFKWMPRRSVSVGASLRHQRRGSNIAGEDFDDSGASISLNALF